MSKLYRYQWCFLYVFDALNLLKREILKMGLSWSKKGFCKAEEDIDVILDLLFVIEVWWNGRWQLIVAVEIIFLVFDALNESDKLFSYLYFKTWL